ncbi:MAG: radical SAM protein [Myxococcota bacterium]
MANIGYIQVVRHCNHLCGFCSNPTTPYTHDFDSMRVLVDDFVARGYFGVILTGGEPSLHPELPRICHYARTQGLHVRMISNGHRLAESSFAQEMADAGLQLAHISIYSVRESVESQLRGTEGTLERAFRALDACHAAGIELNVNCVINRFNADHLDENVAVLTSRFPFIKHFVWNNLDPSMGRAETNQSLYTPRLADFELSLRNAMRRLQRSGRTFRVEKVPLCYMTEFAWASTETRKIVKGEERIVCFLDEKQSVRQTDWEHIYAESCSVCTLRTICGGLFDRGGGYDPAELAPVFISREKIVRHILEDETDPSFLFRGYEEWERDFERRVQEAQSLHKASRDQEKSGVETTDGVSQTSSIHSEIPVGKISEKGMRLYRSKRKQEARRAANYGFRPEQPLSDMDSDDDNTTPTNTVHTKKA